MEAYPFRVLQVAVKEKLDPVPVREVLLCQFRRVGIMDQSQRRDGTRLKSQASVHALRRRKRELALTEHMLEGVDCQFLMAFEHNEIVTVALMVPEEQVLAVDRINILPVLKSQLYRRKRRMCMKFKTETMLLEKVQDLGYTWVICHFVRLFA